MFNSTLVKNGLIPAVVYMMGAWLVNDGCDFVKLIKWQGIVLWFIWENYTRVFHEQRLCLVGWVFGWSQAAGTCSASRLAMMSLRS